MNNEITKCHKPNNELTICRECQRNSEAENNEYETFNLVETRSSGWKCDGYVSKKETKGLFYE